MQLCLFSGISDGKGVFFNSNDMNMLKCVVFYWIAISPLRLPMKAMNV